MKFALVGVGGAGGRVVNALRNVEKNSDRTFTNDQSLVFDTEQAAFEEFTQVPADRHVLIGDTHPDIRGGGLDGDVDLGAAVAEEDTDEIYREFDKLATHEVHATVVVAGLGGGTGGGVGPVILEGLKSIADGPVYVLGILPAESESDRRAYNAARALQSYVDLADNVILFDNEEWYDAESDSSLEAQYNDLNVELVTRIIAVLAVGELEDAPIAETMLDASDTMKTLNSGGVSSLGYATVDLDRPTGLLAKLLSFFRSAEPGQEITDAAKIKELIQATVRSKLTLPCDVSSTERAMLSLSGPPEVCSRKGFETGRYWLEDETDTVQIWAGDEPHDASMIAASVLLSNVTEVPRIDEIQERAVAYKRGQEGTEADGSTGDESATTETSESDEAVTDEASDAATTETSEGDDAATDEAIEPAATETTENDDAAMEAADDGSTDPSSAESGGSDDGSGEGTVGTEERIPDTD
jgi:cell division GTPase FtsZ